MVNIRNIQKSVLRKTNEKNRQRSIAGFKPAYLTACNNDPINVIAFFSKVFVDGGEDLFSQIYTLADPRTANELSAGLKNLLYTANNKIAEIMGSIRSFFGNHQAAYVSRENSVKAINIPSGNKLIYGNFRGTGEDSLGRVLLKQLIHKTPFFYLILALNCRSMYVKK